MNILIINHYAGSPEMGMEFRPYYFAREWVRKGHKVDIIAANFSHLRRVNPEIVYDLEMENIDGINYHWIKTGKYEHNGIKRAMSMFQFVFKLKKHSKKIVELMQPDVVICSSTYPLDTYVGQKIKSVSKKPVKLIHEVHDMWPLSPIEMGGMSESNPFIKVMQKAEDSFCENSDLVVSLLPAAKDYLVEHGMTPNKFEVVMNGVDFNDWDNPQELPKEIIDHFKYNKSNGKLNIVFCGSIHKTYGLEPLIEAIGMVDIACLTLIGPGLDKNELMQKAEPYKEKIRFFDPIPKNSIPLVFKYADVSYVASLPYSLNRFGICMNKLFDSMMGAKPILYAVDAPNNYIKEYNCGISVDITDINSLVDGICRLANMKEEERAVMGSNGHQAIIDEFNYEKLSQKFLELFY